MHLLLSNKYDITSRMCVHVKVFMYAVYRKPNICFEYHSNEINFAIVSTPLFSSVEKKNTRQWWLCGHEILKVELKSEKCGYTWLFLSQNNSMSLILRRHQMSPVSFFGWCFCTYWRSISPTKRQNNMIPGINLLDV